MIQLAVSLAVLTPARVFAPPYLWYIPVGAVLHIALVAFLFWRAKDFRHTVTGAPFRRVNLACHLTLFRFSCAPTILLLAVGVSRGHVSGVPLVILVAAAFLSDFLDGQAARRLNQTTEIGKYLDSSTDYAVLIVLSVAFLIMSVTPAWYFTVLMVRLVGFTVAMAVLARVQGEVSAETTFLGKAAIFSAMTTYAFELARYAGIRGIGNDTVVLVIELVSAAVLAASMIDKAIYLVRKFRTARQ